MARELSHSKLAAASLNTASQPISRINSGLYDLHVLLRHRLLLEAHSFEGLLPVPVQAHAVDKVAEFAGPVTRARLATGLGVQLTGAVGGRTHKSALVNRSSG